MRTNETACVLNNFERHNSKYIPFEILLKLEENKVEIGMGVVRRYTGCVFPSCSRKKLARKQRMVEERGRDKEICLSGGDELNF